MKSHKKKIARTYRSAGDVQQRLDGGYGIYDGRVHLVNVLNKTSVTVSRGTTTPKTVSVKDPLLNLRAFPLGYVNPVEAPEDQPYCVFLSRRPVRQYKQLHSGANVRAVSHQPAGRDGGRYGGRGYASIRNLQKILDQDFPTFAEAVKTLEKHPNGSSLAISSDIALVSVVDVDMMAERTFLRQLDVFFNHSTRVGHIPVGTSTLVLDEMFMDQSLLARLVAEHNLELDISQSAFKSLGVF
jgi:hypothetical protein